MFYGVVFKQKRMKTSDLQVRYSTGTLNKKDFRYSLLDIGDHRTTVRNRKELNICVVGLGTEVEVYEGDTHRRRCEGERYSQYNLIPGWDKAILE